MGSSGGYGGFVTVANAGAITAHDDGSLGIYAQSIGGSGGDAGDIDWGVYTVGGRGSGTSDGGVVNVVKVPSTEPVKGMVGARRTMLVEGTAVARRIYGPRSQRRCPGARRSLSLTRTHTGRSFDFA